MGEEPRHVVQFQLVSPFHLPAINRRLSRVDVRLPAGRIVRSSWRHGSGKTFTAATSSRAARPTLVLSHNKTLAAQLYKEFRAFPAQRCPLLCQLLRLLPTRSLHPQRDIYIEKDAIESMRTSIDCVWQPPAPSEPGRCHHRRQRVVHLRLVRPPTTSG